MVMEETTRRQWAFWRFEQEMEDKPFPANEQARAILELGLCRNASERELLAATVAADEREELAEAERVRLGYRMTSSS